MLRLTLFLAMACLLMADTVVRPPVKPPVVDPNATTAIEKEALEVEAMVKELPVKEAALVIKIYSGTIDDVYSDHAVDVNDVLTYAIQMRDRAKAVCEAMDLKPSKQDFIKSVIDRHAKIPEKENQKRNGEFLGAVLDVIEESQLPADDPNYVAHNEAMYDLWACCVEAVNPK